MANQEHLDILKQGVEAWNKWREEHPDVKPDLIGADLRKAALQGAYLRAVDFRNANLMEANLSGADLSDADLCVTDLTHADLSNASLLGARLLKTILTDAILTNCSIYGISAWDVQLEGAQQHNLVITPSGEPTITVDNLKVAQFIYLLLSNKEIRDVIDTIAKKAVLILGRFTPERKAILDALRDELRKQNYLPVLFDFDKPASRDFTETIRTLGKVQKTNEPT